MLVLPIADSYLAIFHRSPLSSILFFVDVSSHLCLLLYMMPSFLALFNVPSEIRFNIPCRLLLVSAAFIIMSLTGAFCSY